MPRPPVALLLLALVLCAALALGLAWPAAGAGRGLSSGPAGAGHAPPVWQWPGRGRVVRRFHVTRDPFARGQHRGVTLAAASGTAVLAPCVGRVRFVGRVGASGRTVTLGCGALNATLTHLGAVLARRGAVVAPGEVVGRARRDGEVHLGARIRARRFGYLDPLTLLTAEPAPPLGPVPVAGRRPLAPPAPPVPRPSAAPAPAGLPLGAVWLPAGLGLLGAAGLFGAARRFGPLLRRRRIAAPVIRPPGVTRTRK